ncbi:unnamed protein product [Darwinula stevensoni]|uniref:Uncharacterized protein n=1 Tax=Darwinula stevensoni TaxID=69355 RepID=A0A7R8X512_9CRUS|nr:unnamed protein product [Darwinula stevensoni]CAG0879658.1 unnamed protein product [Darwinula stevensoni]
MCQSDLDADDEDNASLHQSDSVNSLVQNVSRSSLSTNGRPANENIEDMLERLRKENSHLHNLLEEKDQQMATLELQVATLHMEVLTLSSERDRLKQENSVLISSLQDK